MTEPDPELYETCSCHVRATLRSLLVSDADPQVGGSPVETVPPLLLTDRPNLYARPDIRERAQPVDAGVRPEVDDHHPSEEAFRRLRIGVEPGRGALERCQPSFVRQLDRVGVRAAMNDRTDHAARRRDWKQARISSEKSCGSSHAAKCPPLSTSWK